MQPDEIYAKTEAGVEFGATIAALREALETRAAI